MLMKHNKKRNAGLLNEFFARYMAKAIVEKRDRDLAKAKELFAKHFQHGTDLYRELKMFNALFETKLNSVSAASSLIEQVKQCCKLQSQTKIDLEKSALLHEINVHLNDPGFFNEEIKDYKDYATIQVLMNHWRGGIITENLSEAAILEDRLVQFLTIKESQEANNASLQMTEDEVDGLVISLMAEKLNKKYSDKLNEEQKKLLQLYVFSKEEPQTKEELTAYLSEMRNEMLSKIESSLNFDPDAKKSETKLLEVRSMLLEDYKDTTRIDDQAITFYMSVSKLKKELTDV